MLCDQIINSLSSGPLYYQQIIISLSSGASYHRQIINSLSLGANNPPEIIKISSGASPPESEVWQRWQLGWRPEGEDVPRKVTRCIVITVIIVHVQYIHPCLDFAMSDHDGGGIYYHVGSVPEGADVSRHVI